MNTALTRAQGTAVLKGRNPFEITSYAQAIKALKECLEIDDAKYWTNFADAAEAWGKIYHDNEAIRLARALKLNAAKHMAELAIKLKGEPKRGKVDGPGALLVSHGMDYGDVKGALTLATNERKAERLIEQERPPSLGSVSRLVSKNPWHAFALGGWSSFLSKIRNNDARAAARLAPHSRGGTDVIREQATAMRDWLDTFIASLPKKVR